MQNARAFCTLTLVLGYLRVLWDRLAFLLLPLLVHGMIACYFHMIDLVLTRCRGYEASKNSGKHVIRVRLVSSAFRSYHHARRRRRRESQSSACARRRGRASQTCEHCRQEAGMLDRYGVLFDYLHIDIVCRELWRLCVNGSTTSSSAYERLSRTSPVTERHNSAKTTSPQVLPS